MTLPTHRLKIIDDTEPIAYVWASEVPDFAGLFRDFWWETLNGTVRGYDYQSWATFHRDLRWAGHRNVRVGGIEPVGGL